jgi:hypothetical protein
VQRYNHFQYCQNFFSSFFGKKSLFAIAQHVKLENIFQKNEKKPKIVRKNGPEMGRKGQNSASSIAHFCTYSFILLNVNNINKIRIVSNSFCKLTTNTLLECMQYQARYHFIISRYHYIIYGIRKTNPLPKPCQTPIKALPSPIAMGLGRYLVRVWYLCGACGCAVWQTKGTTQ